MPSRPDATSAATGGGPSHAPPPRHRAPGSPVALQRDGLRRPPPAPCWCSPATQCRERVMESNPAWPAEAAGGGDNPRRGRISQLSRPPRDGFGPGAPPIGVGRNVGPPDRRRGRAARASPGSEQVVSTLMGATPSRPRARSSPTCRIPVAAGAAVGRGRRRRPLRPALGYPIWAKREPPRRGGAAAARRGGGAARGAPTPPYPPMVRPPTRWAKGFGRRRARAAKCGAGAKTLAPGGREGSVRAMPARRSARRDSAPVGRANGVYRRPLARARAGDRCMREQRLSRSRGAPPAGSFRFQICVGDLIQGVPAGLPSHG